MTRGTCKHCGEDVYLQAWMGDDGEEFDWSHEWSGDSLCDSSLRELCAADAYLDEWPPLGATLAEPELVPA